MMITPSDFLTFLYDDERGYIEVVAGDTNRDKPEKIDLVMQTRRWIAYPAQLDQALAYIDQLATTHGNVYVGERLYTKAAKDANQRSEDQTLPSRVIFVDDAPEEPYLFYSLSIRTSEHSRHAYYKADAPTTKDDARRAAKYLGGDPSGVDLTQLVRVVDTFNTKHNKRFPVVIEDVGPTYKLDDLRAIFPQVEPEKGKGTIEALNWPKVETHLSNIDALLGCARSQLIKPTTQTGRILGGEMIAFPVNGRTDDSRSMNACAVALGLLLRGFPDDEIVAVLIHLYHKWGSERDKGTAWVKLDAGRCLAYAHEQQPNVKQSPTRYKRTAQAEPIAEVKPISRARTDRPQRFTAAALYLEYQRRPDLCTLKRKARAAALSISTATLDRLEDALETENLIEIETDPRRQGSRVILRGVINIAPAEVLSAAPETEAPDRLSISAQSGQTAIEQPQCIGETPTPPNTPGPAPRRCEDCGALATNKQNIAGVLACRCDACTQRALCQERADLIEAMQLWPARHVGKLKERLVVVEAMITAGGATEPDPAAAEPDDAGVDWADIERRIASITPDEIERVYAEERHDPALVWERHEARTWHASHEPTVTHDEARERTKRERDRERCRAKWAKLAEAGDYAALEKERAILRNKVKGTPSARSWAAWRIRELGELLAQRVAEHGYTLAHERSMLDLAAQHRPQPDRTGRAARLGDAPSGASVPPCPAAASIDPGEAMRQSLLTALRARQGVGYD